FARIHLGDEGREEAATHEDARLDVAQVVLRQGPKPREAGPGVRRGLDDVLVEELLCRVDRRELELLLRAEVRVQAALAHPDGLGEATDGEAVDALDGRELRSCLEDRGSAPHAVRPSLARRARRSRLLSRLAHRLTR